MTPILLSVLVVCVCSVGGAVPSCPSGCTCEEAPLKDASFVLAWMTSWGEDDLPQMHPNDVRDAGAKVGTGTAASAGVDVDVVGVHATCALMADTNLTHLTHTLPPQTMVLTVLQSSGGGVVVVEAKHLEPLRELRALHLQGYARRHTTQVSGYFPNTVAGMVAQKEAAMAAAAEGLAEGELQMAISEDALNPLTRLQLLDLQYVRLMAGVGEDRGRLRRQVEPVESDTLVDLPLPYFLSLMQQLKNANIDMPPELLAMLPTDDPHPEVEVVMLDDEPEIVSYEVLRAGGGEHLLLAPFLAQKQLRYLRVAHARLDKVGRELLQGLGKLHTLTLEYNNIKVLPSNMFATAPHLQHLSLAHNSLLALDAESLSGLNDLVTLDLDHNQLDQLGPTSFPYLPKLATLRLLANPLTHVFPFTFDNLNTTETLVMGSRLVAAEVHEDTFSTLSDLTTLRLDNITLTSLSNALLSGMPHLRYLTLHGSIPSINFDAFTDTPLLRSLTLSHCQLDRLSQDAFFGLRELRYLDLSHNKLALLHPGTFDPLVSLRELYLHHNQLTSLPHALFHRLPVKLVQLHQNPWDCTCRLLQLPPTLTNKVRHQGYTICRWDEKAGTVCVVPDPVPVRFDSRVAPLCVTPNKYRHLDVYHAAARQLKCPRSEWDPRFTHESTPAIPAQSSKPTDSNNSLNPPAEEVEPVDELEPAPEIRGDSEGLPVVEEESDWDAFIAFTPPPIPVKDILEIYEAEMPLEVYAPVDEAQENRVGNLELGEVEEGRREGEEELEGEVNYLDNWEEETEMREVSLEREGEEAKEINQAELDNNLLVIPHAVDSDANQVSHREEELSNLVSSGRAWSRSRAEYLQEKERIKAEMLEERRRRQEELMARKQEYWRNLAEEKRREKARREEERRSLLERRAAQMEELMRMQNTGRNAE